MGVAEDASDEVVFEGEVELLVGSAKLWNLEPVGSCESETLRVR